MHPLPNFVSYRLAAALIAVLLAGFPAVVDAADNSAEVPLPEGTRLLANLAYVEGGDPHQVLDLYLPPGKGPWPLIIYLHGGGLTGGKRDWARKEAVHNLLPEGYAIASVEYRFVNHAPFPAPMEDCKRACAWLKAHAGQYDLDAERVGVWGYSAGAMLAGLLATTVDSHEFERGVPGDYRVKAALIWSGRCDLTHVEGMTDREKDVIRRYFGTKLPDIDLDAARQASPLTYLRAGAPPFLIVHGDQDPLASVWQTGIWETAVKKVGGDVTVEIRKGMTHDIPEDYDYTGVKRFFARTLRAPAKP